MSFHIVLYEPEIPPNTGNIIRLCANTGAQLHLIEPLGFFLNEKTVARAGLDYAENARAQTHLNWQTFLEKITPTRIFAATTKGKIKYTDATFLKNDVLLFGPETRGLPNALLATLSDPFKIRIPMQKVSRSMNLSNSVAVILYEALRQVGHPDLV